MLANDVSVPHRRGDEPAQLNRQPHESSSVPHRRGDEPADTAIHAMLSQVFPTGVGMNRMDYHLHANAHSVPHRRGDEPAHAMLTDWSYVFPTGVGMNRYYDQHTCDTAVFPTGVGMNRIDNAIWMRDAIVFPTGVGMNRCVADDLRDLTCSPQAWG